MHSIDQKAARFELGQCVCADLVYPGCHDLPHPAPLSLISLTQAR